MISTDAWRYPLGAKTICGRIVVLSLVVPLCLALTGCPGKQPDEKSQGSEGGDKSSEESKGPWSPPGGKWDIKETPIFDKQAAAEKFIAGTLRISPDGRRYAFARKEVKQQRWVVDGKDEPLAFQLDEAAAAKQFQFSENGKHYWYTCKKPKYESLVIDGAVRDDEATDYGISGDGQLFAYASGFKSQEKGCVCLGDPRALGNVIMRTTETAIRWASLDGSGVTVDDKTTTKGSITEFQFSANGKSYAFLLDNTRAVVNGKPHGKRFDRVVSKLFLSADGEHVLYAGFEGKQNYVSYDNQWLEIDSAPAALVLSPDGKHWACRVDNAIVLDGKKVKEYPTAQWQINEALSPILFSPDSKDLAYAAGEKVKITDDKGKEVAEKYFAFMVRNGVEQTRFAQVDFAIAVPFFSPDGRYLAYYAREAVDGDEYLVINGAKVMKPNVAYLPAALPSFSPDSTSVGFVMKKQGEWFPVLDGQELKKDYEEIAPGGLRVGFTPDGTYTFIALRGGAYYWVEARRK